MSDFLRNLNLDPIKEATHTYAFVAIRDTTMPPYVYGRITHEWPTMDHAVIFNATEYDHIGVRDLTCPEQYAIIQSNDPHYQPVFLQ